MKKKIALIIMVILLTVLAGCSGKGSDSGKSDPDKSAGANPPSSAAVTPEATEQNEGVLLRCDEEGLVEVRIEDGQAELTFDLAKWNNLYDIYNIYNALETENASLLREGPYEVKSSAGKEIKDVCVGMVEALNDCIYGFDNLTLVLLLEDGTLEYCPVYPYPGQVLDDWVLYGWGKLPWLPDVVSLLYEPDGEGIGEMTIYAADRNGLCYDVRTLCRLTSVFDCDWVYEIGPGYGGGDINCIRLTLWEDGQVFLTKGLLYNGDCWKFYKGKYAVTLTGDKPVLAFELWDEWEDPDFSMPPELSGEYFFTSGYDDLTLYLADGDPLQYAGENSPVMTYPFWPIWSDNYEPYTWYEDDELADYLLSNVPFAYELVYEQHMSALVTGETVDLTDMGAGVCRIVILGTNHPGHFVNEQFFAISDTGDIYVYSVADDIWWYHAPYAYEESE